MMRGDALPSLAAVRLTGPLPAPAGAPMRRSSPRRWHPSWPVTPMPADPRPLILVLSVSAGAGHVRAAEALCAAAAGLPHARVLHLDALDFMPARFRWLYADLYLRLVKRFPRAWGALYHRMNRVAPGDRMQRLRRRLERRMARALLRRIGHLRPAAVVCTHFMPAELLAYEPGSLGPGVPVWVQVTDFDVHRLWMQPGVAGYFVAGDAAASRLREAGVPPQRMHRTGLAIMPAFACPPGRDACAARLGLDARAPTVLLMGGGCGMGDFAGTAQRLLAADGTIQVIALTGRNTALAESLAALAAASPGRLVVQRHTNEVERFMACADLVVTKPGGLSSAECLAMGLPMILQAPIPGQEEANAALLIEAGVALGAGNTRAATDLVLALLARPSVLSEMARRARAMARPHAAGAILHLVLAQFPQPASQ